MKYSVVFLLAAFAFAQDKAPMPPQQPPVPVAPTSTESKTVILSKEETVKVKDGVFTKAVYAPSEGYSEVRYTVVIKPPRGKKFGANAKVAYTLSTCSMSEGTDVVEISEKRNEKFDAYGRYRELATAKVYGGRSRIFLRVEELELDEAVVTIEAYLVR
jgi:hypothetical protein